ncbi:hypothetical protein HK405_013984, partial [Cladochytrium tenue]
MAHRYTSLPAGDSATGRPQSVFVPGTGTSSSASYSSSSTLSFSSTLHASSSSPASSSAYPPSSPAAGSSAAFAPASTSSSSSSASGPAAAAAAAAQQGVSWDALRRHAKQLENEIEARLTGFAKAAAVAAAAAPPLPATGAYAISIPSSEGSSSASAVPQASDAWVAAGNAERDLEDLMRKLSNVVNSMAAFLDMQAPVSANPSMMHMLQRHRDILYDYSKEFKRTKSNLSAARDHAQLLGGGSMDDHPFRNSSAQEYLLSERNKIDGAHGMADQVLEQAYETREQLDAQRRMLQGSRTRLGGTMNRVPLVNQLLARIGAKKRRDAIVVAVVVAVCVTLLLIYIFR